MNTDKVILRIYKTTFLLISGIILFTSSVFAQESSNSDIHLDQSALPVLSDTTDFEKLRTQLIELHALLREDLEMIETIAPMMQELCPVYYDMRSTIENKKTRQFWDAFEGLKRSDSINYQFLERITEVYRSKALAYKKPLGAVFQGVLPSPEVFEPNEASIPEQQFWKGVRDSEGIIETNLEFVKNVELDELMFEEYRPVCADCPESKRYQQTFARLKGYEDFYFTYTREPEKAIDETSVPQRSLIYYDGDVLHTVYTTKMDLFGCGCM